MIRSAFITLVGQRLGKRTSLDDVILSEMDMAQQTVLERNGILTPWFIETEVAQVSTTAGEERVPIPSDFAKEKEEGGLFIYDGSAEQPWVRLDKDAYDYIVLKYQDSPGVPEMYSLGGMYFRVRPIPLDVYTLKMVYFATQTLPSALASDGENVWLKYAPDWFAAEVCKMVAEKHIQDLELAAKFDPDITRAMNRVRIESESQQHTNRSYSMGEL